MKNMTIANIAKAAGGTYIGPDALLNREISSVVTDSRKVVPDCMYVAIRGERVDGHRFIPQVVQQGALVVLAEQMPEVTEQAYGGPSAPTIVVDATLRAVRDIAEFYLQQLHKPIVGIIGSVGKTSTKEMTASVLSQKYTVLKTEGNFNNELGVPMTAFRMREEDDMGVLEMGINHFGEMHRLAKIVRPDTVVMTNIGTAHLEFLKTRDGILQAKSEVFDYFSPNGHIVLNGDDDKLSLIEEKQGVVPIRFGIGERGFAFPNDVWADEIEPKGLDGISCRIHMPEETFSVMIPVPGRHMVYNALAGACVGRIYGLSAAQIKAGIEQYASLSGRFHLIHTDRYTIVDDCYNANPASMKASLEILQDGSGRRVAVLGDMGELGNNEKPLHAEIGKFAAGLRLDALYCIGPLSRNIADAAVETLQQRKEAGKMDVQHFADMDSFLVELPNLVKTGDTILVKASHFMHFEKIVQALGG